MWLLCNSTGQMVCTVVQPDEYHPDEVGEVHPDGAVDFIKWDVGNFTTGCWGWKCKRGSCRGCKFAKVTTYPRYWPPVW